MIKLSVEDFVEVLKSKLREVAAREEKKRYKTDRELKVVPADDLLRLERFADTLAECWKDDRKFSDTEFERTWNEAFPPPLEGGGEE
ncbi:MAG: hypothetical protein Kow0069_16170 [Promethearchaeota archaeon]